MTIKVFSSKATLAQAAADHAAAIIRDAISAHGEARIIAATGASQFDFLDALTKITDIDWDRVEMFHLDEYVGITDQAPASFCRYLRERLIDKVGLKKYHLLDGTEAPAAVIERVSAEIRKAPIDVAFVGVGENGHLAFMDPAVADFNDPQDVKVVKLDADCRAQQVAEGWFSSLGEVPDNALSMTIPAILRVPRLIVSVPGVRKAAIIRRTLTEAISTSCPATILRTHPNVTLYLDEESASELDGFLRQS